MYAQSTNYLKAQGTKVLLPWSDGDTSESWNEVCAWVIETFGLPGTKYEYHATPDGMSFIFVDEKDAVHCMLRCL